MLRNKINIYLTTIAVLLFATTAIAEEKKINEALSGGELTVFNTGRDAFAKPAPNLPTKDLRDFTFGNKVFNTNWVTAPASVTSLDGLGPTFNRVSCSGCHFKDGRGRPPLSNDKPMNSMLLRLSIPGVAADGGPKPHPVYGGQLNDKAIQGVPAEGQATIFYTESVHQYPDGQEYSLRTPQYVFNNLKFGELGADIMFSPRTAPAIHGLGLLEAIPEEVIYKFANENAGVISGRPNIVPGLDGNKTIGRFGWKANVATLRQQDAGAALGDMGITTSLNSEQNCPTGQTACMNSIDGGKPEMSDMQLDKLIFYTQTLAVPARRNLGDPLVKLGEEMFKKAGCQSCHKTNIITGKHEIAQLSEQLIHPYTDLLLHDMGDDLADGRADYLANGNEWRTPPLWGIGLVKTVNKHTNFLHDGRARDFEEAILWHGGEAAISANKFKHMTQKERAALIKFIESL